MLVYMISSYATLPLEYIQVLERLKAHFRITIKWTLSLVIIFALGQVIECIIIKSLEGLLLRDNKRIS